MPAGTELAGTVFVPPTEEERSPDGQAEMVVDDREVVVIEDDTPPRTNVVEWVEVEGGGNGDALEEAPQATADGAS